MSDSSGKGSPPWLQLSLGVLTLIGILGAAYIAGGWQYGNWGNTNSNANSSGGAPSSNVNLIASAEKLEVKIVMPETDGNVTAVRRGDGSAAFPVRTKVSGNIPTENGEAVVLLMIKQGDAWWAQDAKKAAIGTENFDAWSGGGPGNAAKVNEPLQIRAIVVKASITPKPGTEIKGGQDAGELEPIAVSDIVDFKINRIGP